MRYDYTLKSIYDNLNMEIVADNTFRKNKVLIIN